MIKCLAEEIREYTAMKYAGDCKCGKCQLVPRELVERIYHTLNGSGEPAQGPVQAGCIGCANGNDLPEGEYCRACGRENNVSPLGQAIKRARGLNAPPKAPVQFDGDPSVSSTDRVSPANHTHACRTCCGDGYINVHANLPDVKCEDCNGTGRGPEEDPDCSSHSHTSTDSRGGK